MKKQKQTALTLIVSVLTVTSQLVACIDPPTPVKLNRSTFASIKMQVIGQGLLLGEIGDFQVRYDVKKRQWCVENRYTQQEECGRPQLPIRDASGSVAGVINFDHRGRKAVLFQVKQPLSRSGFTIDNSVSRIEFSDESDALGAKIENGVDAGSDIFVTRAKKASGEQLGVVTSKHQRNTKAVSVPGETKPGVDLEEEKITKSGCGGSSEEVPEFEIGNEKMGTH
jgi:hypothetical protein